MKRNLAWLALLGVWAAAPVAEAGGAAESTCGIRGAQTELVTPKLRIVWKSFADGDGFRTWGCLRVSPADGPRVRRAGYRKRRVINSFVCGDVCASETVVSRQYPYTQVAWTFGECVRGASCGGILGVVDIRTGRRQKTGIDTERVAGLDVTGRGTAVWMDDVPGPPGATTFEYEVRALTPAGENLLFDRGTEISELALGPRRLYWMSAGETKSAAVP
jgi:hypothetical protein